MLATFLFAAFAIDPGAVTRDASGKVVAIDLSSSWITDSDLAPVAGNAGLLRLDLSRTKITDAGLKHLKPLRELREVSFRYAEFITADGLAVLKNWTRLEKLDLRGARVTSRIFEHMGTLRNLRDLDLGFTEITDEGFDQLIQLPKLERLVIGGNRLNGECLDILRQIASLRDLDIGGTQRVDSGLWGLSLTASNLARVGALTQLRRLSLAAATISDRGVDRPGHPEAERTELRDLSAVANLRDLEFLDLSRQPVAADSLRGIASLPNLRSLRLGMCKKIDDSAVSVLRSMKSLREIYTAGSAISAEGIAELVLASKSDLNE